MAFGPLQALLIAQVGAPSRGSEASKGRPDPLGQGSVIATLPHLSAKRQRVPVNQRPVAGLRRQLLQRRSFGTTAALGVGQGAGFNRMVELLQTAPQISL